MGQRFDNRRLQLAGDAVLIAEDLPGFGTPTILGFGHRCSGLHQQCFLARPTHVARADGKKLVTVGELGQHWGVVLSQAVVHAACTGWRRNPLRRHGGDTRLSCPKLQLFCLDGASSALL